MIKLIQRNLYCCGWLLIILYVVFPPDVLAALKPDQVVKKSKQITKCGENKKVDEQMSKIVSKCRVSNGKVSACATRCLLFQAGYITKDFKKFVDDSKLAKNLMKFQGLTDKAAKKFAAELKKANCKGKVPKPNECSKYEAVLACTHVAFKKIC